MHQKIFFACFLGALIGALIGINLGLGSFWAGLAGFIAGYLTYDFGQVRQISKSIAKETYDEVANWRPDRRRWKAIFLNSIVVSRAAFTLISIPMLARCYWKGNTLTESLLIVVIIQVMALLFLAVVISESIETATIEQWTYNAPAQNPVKFWLWSVHRWVLTQAVRIIIFLFSIARRTPRFTLGVLRLIHSDIRLLCGTDAAIGSIVGFYFGYAIVGALVGGLLGVLNYELVSKRLLKINV